MREERTDYAVGIPYLSSLILTHSLDGEVPGLKEFPRADRPNAAIVFWSFRIMVGVGLLMALVGAASLWLRWRGRLHDHPWFQRAVLVMGPSGFVAILAGWVTTEVGRQPFTVYGLMRTSESVSPIGLPGVATSLAVFAVVYFFVFGAGTLILLRMMAKAPERGEAGPYPGTPTRTAGITPGPAGAISDPGAAAAPAE